MPAKAAFDQSRLLAWYDAHRRDLPWRRSTDPYSVWVSETMLQQTTVAAVVPYFEQWMARFPTVESLALADDDAALVHWAGLGYYSRCRRLLAGARWVVENGWPQTLQDWMKVPGVGPYTAAAIGSISQSLPLAVVDGNVERVYARFNADPASGTKLKRSAQSWATSVLCKERPGDWNQALMELGATVCRPRTPECVRCPVRESCSGLKGGNANAFPTAPVKTLPIELEHTIWVPLCGTRFGIVQTPSGQWWAGMWGFPRSDNDSAQTAFENAAVSSLGKFVYTVTKHRICVQVFLAESVTEQPGLVWVELDDLAKYAMPTPQRRALDLALSRLGVSPGQPSLFNGKGQQGVDADKGKAVEE